CAGVGEISREQRLSVIAQSGLTNHLLRARDVGARSRADVRRREPVATGRAPSKAGHWRACRARTGDGATPSDSCRKRCSAEELQASAKKRILTITDRN